MITKPLMSGKWGLMKSTCSCRGPLLKGVILNWTEAFSWGSRLGTLGKEDGRKYENKDIKCQEMISALRTKFKEKHTKEVKSSG